MQILQIQGDFVLVQRDIAPSDCDDEGHVTGDRVEEVDYRAQTLTEWWPCDEIFCSDCGQVHDQCDCDTRNDHASYEAEVRRGGAGCTVVAS